MSSPTTLVDVGAGEGGIVLALCRGLRVANFYFESAGAPWVLAAATFVPCLDALTPPGRATSTSY